MICLGCEALRSHCLLDVLLKLFILLTPHLIDLLLWVSLQVLHHLLRQLTLCLLLPGEDSFNDLLPECLHIGTPLTGAFWLIDARERVLTGSDVNSICWVDLDIALRRHFEKLRHKQRPVELTGELLTYRGKHQVAAIGVSDVAKRHAQLLLYLRVILVCVSVKLGSNDRDTNWRDVDTIAVLTCLPWLPCRLSR